MTSSPRRGRHAATAKPLRTQFRRWPHPHHAKPRPAAGPKRRLATAGLGAIAVTGVTTLALTSAAPAFASSARAAPATTTTARASHQRGQLVSVTPLRPLPTVAAVKRAPRRSSAGSPSWLADSRARSKPDGLRRRGRGHPW